jgi:hypothetical protein
MVKYTSAFAYDQEKKMLPHQHCTVYHVELKEKKECVGGSLAGQGP